MLHLAMKKSYSFAALLLLIALSFLLVSCEKPVKDVIGLSQNEITLGAEGGVVVIDATGAFTLEGLYTYDSSGKAVPMDNSCGRVINGSEMFLKGDWIEAHKTSTSDHLEAVNIQVSPNSGSFRKCRINVMLGDYFDCIIVKQNSAPGK